MKTKIKVFNIYHSDVQSETGHIINSDVVASFFSAEEAALQVEKFTKEDATPNRKYHFYEQRDSIEVGKFLIESDPHLGDDVVWLTVNFGEGGTFDKKLLEPYLQEFYSRYF